MTATRTRPRKTLADLYALPDEARAELIDGEILMAPAPTPWHQRVSGRIFTHVGAFVRARRLGELYYSPIDVVLPSGNVVQPDLVFVATRNARIVRDRIEGVPDLLVEIVSPSNPERDRFVKRDLYARAGVAEYWIVDPDAKAIEVLRLAAQAYEPAGYFEAGESLGSATFPGLALPVADLFA